MTRNIFFVQLSLLLLIPVQSVDAADGHGSHGHQPVQEKLYPPRVFLNKRPEVIAWQLNRLENRRLLLIERSADDAKFLPVYREILTRTGMSPSDREQALAATVKLNRSDPISELLSVIADADPKVPQQRKIAAELTRMLVDRDTELLTKRLTRLRAASKSEKRAERIAGLAGLVASGHTTDVTKFARKQAGTRRDLLSAIPFLKNKERRLQLKDFVIESLTTKQPANVRLAAIRSLNHVSEDHEANFNLLAPMISDEAFRDAVVQSLLAIPQEHRDSTTAAKLIDSLIHRVESTPAEQRTTDPLIDATQLATELLTLLPSEESAPYREKLKSLAVNRVRIKTVDEEMRYDIPWFAVESGTSVQLVLINEDAMPHNLVITVPGAMREVADDAVAIGPRPSIGLPYVPMSEKVLQATGMVQAGQEDRITFTAPTEPGEYPFVCTFPGHWMRMYGVMVVTDDLQAFLKDPVEPTDPTGMTREFVKAWTMEDFAEELKPLLEGRSADVGMQVFAEASCAQCHQMKGIGGAIGPELSDVVTRWKGDYQGVLREILDPSHKIEEKYAMQTVETIDGLIIAGLVTREDEKTITIVENALSTEPTVVNKDDIEDMYKASQSMMPKSLMDRFTKDEILDLLAYLGGE